MSNIPVQPLHPANKQPAPAPQLVREPDAPSFDALLRHLRQEVARFLQLPLEARAKEEAAIRSLASRTLSRYGPADKAALPPPLKQLEAYYRNASLNESLSKYLEVRRADLALDDRLTSDGDDKDAIGEPSPDAGRDSDEDAIGSEHPKSPSLGPSASPAGAQRQLPPRLPTPSPSSSRPTSGNTTVSSPEPRSTVSAPPRGEKRKHAPEPGPDDTVFEGDARCSNCILRNAKQCIVEPSRQRCNTCFTKRHRCSKVLTPPTRPSRDKSASKGKGQGDTPADTAGESASARAPKRKRTATEEETKRTEPAKRPARPARPATTTASAAGPSTSASAPVQRPAAPKKPAMPNGNAAASSSTSAPQTLSLLAASASRAPRAPTAPANANANAQPRHQYYQEKLQVLSGILGMVQTAVKELQDQVAVDAAAGRLN